MASLTTRTAFKAFAGISVTTWDDLIDTILTQASDAIEAYCWRTFASADYVEQYNGKGQKTLCLQHYPIVSITDIREDAARTFNSTSVIPSTDYAFDANSGIVYFDGWRLGRGVKNVKVTYTAGYSATPTPVALACHKLMGAVFNKRKDSGQGGVSLGAVSFNYAADWPEDVMVLLERYVCREVSE